MNACLCGQPAKDATICSDCERRLTRALEEVPALMAELDTVLARQTRTGSTVGYVKGNGTRPVPYDQQASDTASTLKATLVAWTRLVLDDNAMHPPMPADTHAALARWLRAQVSWLRLHDLAGHAVQEIADAVDAARRVALRQTRERHYRGPCRTEWNASDGPATCLRDLYASGLTADTVTCSQCGAKHQAQDRRDWLRAQAEERLYTQTELRQLLKVLSDRPLPDRVLSGWIARKRLVEHSTTPDGEPLYRAEDLFVLAATLTRPCRQCGDSIPQTGRTGKPSAFCSEDCRRKADAARKRAA